MLVGSGRRKSLASSIDMEMGDQADHFAGVVFMVQRHPRSINGEQQFWATADALQSAATHKLSQTQYHGCHHKSTAGFPELSGILFLHAGLRSSPSSINAHVVLN
ncbi:hypothetical protein OPV22_017319 [Ensete ventricosum]|uniref:Uncharacterized protein n=1 Tax=Ensete ventricosum TaxID=4639 RepID=A0AAV8QXK3_ENSVE|nr:hypothetical protein OPV22_017319 [Ensete ventricosum]